MFQYRGKRTPRIASQPFSQRFSLISSLRAPDHLSTPEINTYKRFKTKFTFVPFLRSLNRTPRPAAATQEHPLPSQHAWRQRDDDS